MHTSARTSKPRIRLGVCIWMHLVNGTGNSPSLGQPTPGVVKQDKSSRGSVDTTKTRWDPQRVRMSSGERPIGAAKGKQSDTEALATPPLLQVGKPGGQRVGGGAFYPTWRAESNFGGWHKTKPIMRYWLCGYHSILHGTPQSVLFPKFWFLATSPNFADSGGGGGLHMVCSFDHIARQVPCAWAAKSTYLLMMGRPLVLKDVLITMGCPILSPIIFNKRYSSGFARGTTV